MAKRLAIPSKEAQLRIVGPKDSFFASRIQRVSMNTDVPTTDVGELGNPELVGITRDTPNVTITFSAYDVGIKVFSVLTGTDSTSYPAGGVNIDQLGEADAILYIKDATLADYVKSAHARRLQVRDFTFTYSVDGESTEDYNLIGSEKRWFKNDVVVDRFVSGTTSFTLTQTPIDLNNGRHLLSVILDGQYLTEVTGVPATGEYAVSGTALTTGDSMTSQCLAIYHANPAGTNWTNISDASMPAAIRGRDVTVKISANSISRVQSVTINGNLNVQNVREMGSRVIAGYQRQVPTVDGNITVLDTDTELIELLTQGTINASGVTEFSVGDGCPDTDISLLIELTDPCDSTAPYTVLKSVYLPDITVVGEAYTANYNQNASQTFNFRSNDAVVTIYSGAKPA